MVRLVILVAFAIGSLRIADADARLCVFPSAKPIDECHKVGRHRACVARAAKRKQVPPRVRIDDGAWVTFAPDRYRCVKVPTKFRFQIENHGELWYSDRAEVPADCAAQRVDLTRPNLYASMWVTCTNRANTDRDDLVD